TFDGPAKDSIGNGSTQGSALHGCAQTDFNYPQACSLAWPQANCLDSGSQGGDFIRPSQAGSLANPQRGSITGRTQTHSSSAGQTRDRQKPLGSPGSADAAYQAGGETFRKAVVPPISSTQWLSRHVIRSRPASVLKKRLDL